MPLPRGGTLSNLTVMPVRTTDGTTLEVTIWINGSPTDLSIDHDRNANFTNTVINTLNRVVVEQGDLISVEFRETGGECQDLGERLDFMESGIETLKEAVTDIAPLILRYNRNVDPESWRDIFEQEDRAENLRDIYGVLTDEVEFKSYNFCGRYNISFMLE